MAESFHFVAILVLCCALGTISTDANACIHQIVESKVEGAVVELTILPVASKWNIGQTFDIDFGCSDLKDLDMKPAERVEVVSSTNGTFSFRVVQDFDDALTVKSNRICSSSGDDCTDSVSILCDSTEENDKDAVKALSADQGSDVAESNEFHPEWRHRFYRRYWWNRYNRRWYKYRYGYGRYGYYGHHGRYGYYGHHH